MLDLIKNWYKAKVSSYEQAVAESNMMTKFTSEASQFVTERPTDGGFIPLNSPTDREKGHLQTNQLDMVRQSRAFYRWDHNARAALQTIQNYVMGKGISLTPKSKDPLLWWVWREFWTADRNKMQLRQFEIPLRLFRDGEVFIEFFSEADLGTKTGKTTVRFIDPLLVKDPTQTETSRISEFDKENTKSGIETDAEDVEDVKAYWVQSRKSDNKFRRVDAKNVYHIKAFADSDQRRGESLVQPVMKLFTQYKQWLENRIILNKMRSAIVLVRKVDGTSTQLQSVVNNLAQAKNQRGNETKREGIRGGTILNANAGVSYEMMAPNINANDVKEDGRNIKLSIAGGTNLPEYVFGDASNANFASSLIAESPFVKGIEYWQMFLEYHFCQIFKQVIQRAVDAGLLKTPSDEEFLRKVKKVAELTEQDDEGNSPRQKAIEELMPEGKMEAPSEIFFGCDMQWPEIVHREIKQQTEALGLQRANGWLSDTTASQILGYDYNEEVRKQKMAEEAAKKTGNPLMGVKSEEELAAEDDDDMNAELEDMLSNLSPQQRQAILNARTPKEAARAMASSMNGNGKKSKGGEDDA